MKKLNKIILLAFIALPVFSCKKEHLQSDSVNGSPVFYFKGNVNSSPVSLLAGTGNYYMYSSYTQDVNNVYNFTGALEQVGCTTCSNSIKITINDYKTTATNGSAIIDSSLTQSYYPYRDSSGGVTNSYEITFFPISDGFGTISTYNWNFGDGTSSTLQTPTHRFMHPGAYNTTLAVSYYSGCNSSASDTTGEGTPHSLLITTATDSITGDLLTCTASTTGGTPPYAYKWNFGDLGTASGANPTHTYASNGQYHVTLITSDKNNNTSYEQFTINPGGDTSNCFVNFAQGLISPDSNSYALSNINIVYTDASGDVYSSANVAIQPTTSYFQILSVANFQTNENNQTTKKLHVQFTCLLKDSKGNTIPITNGDAVIAVAYK